jgi:hypothetical protein
MSDTMDKSIKLFEVQNHLNRYTCAVNRRDWQELGAVFSERGVWECAGPPDLKFDGREAIVGGLRRSITNAKMLVQLNSPACIQIEGQHVSARSTMHEVADFPSQGSRCEVFGMYEDSLTNKNGVWLFESRRFTIIDLRNIKAES